MVEPLVPSHEDSRKPKLLHRAREIMRLKHDSIRTAQSYLQWMRRFILFHGKRHPDQLGPAAIRAFLTDLAMERVVL